MKNEELRQTSDAVFVALEELFAEVGSGSDKDPSVDKKEIIALLKSDGVENFVEESIEIYI